MNRIESPPRILIVDDSPVNVKLIRVLLELEGYVIVTAADAESAMREIESRLPDLILMDVQLPMIDGLTLTRTLKDDTRWKGVPIIALTAYAMKGDEVRAYEAGCDAYITKPIDTRTFVAIIAENLQRHRNANAT